VGDRRRGRRAVLVDRDGTIIHEREYLADPAGVELVPGAVRGLAAFHAAGFAVVIITNQSGIARGLLPEDAYAAVQREVVARLAREGVPVLGSYHCPHHPDFTGPCDCRKPATGLFERAAREHDLDLGASVFIGDRLRDVQPARAFGGIGALVRTGYGREEEARADGGVRTFDDVAEAASTILASLGNVDSPRPGG